MQQLLLQKEREDITASYKSTQAELPKDTNVKNFGTWKIPSRGDSPPSGLQSVAPPVKRGSPDSGAGVDGLGVTGLQVVPAFGRQISDTAASLVSSYHSFQRDNGCTTTLRRSLDSTFSPSLNSKDLLPRYLAPHGFSGAEDDPCSRSVDPARIRSSAESLNDVGEQGQVEFKVAFAHGGLSDEAVHGYCQVSGSSFCSLSDADLIIKPNFTIECFTHMHTRACIRILKTIAIKKRNSILAVEVKCREKNGMKWYKVKLKWTGKMNIKIR